MSKNNNKKAIDLANAIINACKEGYNVRFSGHCSDIIVDFTHPKADGWHYHVCNYLGSPDKLLEMKRAVNQAKELQEKLDE